MRARKTDNAFQKLLATCEELQRLRARITDPEVRRETRARLRRSARRKADSLGRELPRFRFRGPLRWLMREFRFRSEHFQVLATLLLRHVRAEDPAIAGRLLLGAIFESSFEVLSAMELLHESGPLRASGLVRIDDDEGRPADLLEARYRISDEALAVFREEVAGVLPEDLRRSRRPGYRNHREYLMDLRILHNLYKLRSERLFNQDRWDRVHAGSLAPARGISKRIEAFWTRVRRKLESSPHAVEFPAVRFQRTHGLNDQEMIVVIHLLFRELYEGIAQSDAVEMLRLISEDETALLRNRRLMTATGALRKGEILQLEPMIEGRELTGEIHLSDWVVNDLFGGADEGIRTDERLDFHLYLKNLDDTGRFFEDLGSGSPD